MFKSELNRIDNEIEADYDETDKERIERLESLTSDLDALMMQVENEYDEISCDIENVADKLITDITRMKGDE